AATMPRTQPNEQELWQEVQPILDEELNRLPRLYRDAVILCYLQGKSHEEAAHQLGCATGTLRMRVSRGLEKLRARFLRRGLGASAGVLGTVLAANASVSAVPAGLAGSTIKAALVFAAGKAATVAGVSVKVIALTEGVVKAMLISKLAKTC